MSKPLPGSWDKKLTQGEQMPAWSFTLRDKNGDDITSFDVKIAIRETLESTEDKLLLTQANGLTKDGATVTVNKLLPEDFKSRGYVAEVKVILGDGKIYKMGPSPITVYKSITNGE